MAIMQDQGFLLVVDGHEANRNLLCRRLQRHGFTTIGAEGGEQALDYICKNNFDVVLLDIIMPDISGMTVLTTIRQSSAIADVPVIMATSSRNSDDMVKALELGANDYVNKLLDFPAVVSRIRTQVARKRAEDTLRESEERFALAMRGANDGLWDWNLITNEMYFSSRWKSMLGYTEDEIDGSPDEWFSRVAPEDKERVRAAIAAHLGRNTEHYECEHRMRHCDGSYRWVLSRGLAVHNDHGEPTRMAGSLTDITLSKVADPVTGLANRVLFLDRLSQIINLEQRCPNQSYAVLLLGLDRFKVVNDSLGYNAGDQLLLAAAERMKSCLRSSDIVALYGKRQSLARLGGDEFAILLENIAHVDDATRVANRLQEILKQPIKLDRCEVYVTASIGIVISTSNYFRAEDVVRDSEIAMHRAKASGKARYEIFDNEMHVRAISRLQIETELHQAIERQEFLVYYQPIVDLARERICGFEALVRWEHPDQGFVSPNDFIPIAEETGLMIPIGAWVLQESCRQLRYWQERFPEFTDLQVSVNLSGKEFFHSDLVAQVGAALRQANLEPSALKLEITESVIMDNAAEAVTMLDQLRILGTQVSIDDFGTGYCSLSYLHTFPLDVLKVDRSFVSRMGDNDTNSEIVRTIISLAHNLGLKVVAEGAETTEDVARLRALGCEYVQGYYYAQPLSAEAATEYLADLI